MSSDIRVKKKHVVNGYRKKHSMIGLAFSIPVIIFLLVFVLYPVVYNIWLSFTNASLMTGTRDRKSVV